MRPNQRALNRARGFRQNSTHAERRAWELLRDRAAGVKFRRQHPIGSWVVDFYCPEGRLAVELEGSVHSQPSQARRDVRKEQFLRQHGIHVLHIPNGWVLEDPEGFIKKVLASLPSPVPLRETPSP